MVAFDRDYPMSDIGRMSIQGGVELSNYGSVASDVSKSLFSAEEYLKMYNVLGAARFDTVISKHMMIVDRALSFNCASVRSASSASSLSSSTPAASNNAPRVVKSPGRGQLRAGEIRRMNSWRVKAVPDGLCYLKLFKTEQAETLVNSLGEWPTMTSLLELPFSVFQSLDELMRFKVVGDKKSVHIVPGGDDGFSFFSSLHGIVGSKAFPVGSFGAVIRSSGLSSLGCRLSVGNHTVVGGLRAASSARNVDELALVIEGAAISDGFSIPGLGKFAQEQCGLIVSGESSDIYRNVVFSEFHKIDPIALDVTRCLGDSVGTERVTKSFVEFGHGVISRLTGTSFDVIDFPVRKFILKNARRFSSVSGFDALSFENSNVGFGTYIQVCSLLTFLIVYSDCRDVLEFLRVVNIVD